MPNGVVGLDIFDDPTSLEYGNNDVVILKGNANSDMNRTQETTKTGPTLDRLAQNASRQQQQENAFMDMGSADPTELIRSIKPVHGTDLDLRRSEQIWKALTHLIYRICYDACSTDPSPTTSSLYDFLGTCLLYTSPSPRD